MLEYVARGSGPPALDAQPRHLLDALRVHRELHPAVLARRGRARQGRAARQDAGRRRGRSTRRCATLYGYMYGHPGKKLLFMGGEFGQWREWNHDRSLDWHLLDDPAHAGAARYVQALNWHYRAEPALHELRLRRRPASAGSTATTTRTASSRSCATRAIPSDFVVMVFNFTPVPRQRLPHRRAGAGLLRRAAEQRQRALRRQQRRQRRRRVAASRSPRTASTSRSRLHRAAARLPAAEKAPPETTSFSNRQNIPVSLT